jgi:hypothetical protein
VDLVDAAVAIPRSLVAPTDNAITGRSLTMLWTILIILAIVALAVFILGRVRGGRKTL